jgi:hypothetical protein
MLTASHQIPQAIPPLGWGSLFSRWILLELTLEQFVLHANNWLQFMDAAGVTGKFVGKLPCLAHKQGQGKEDSLEKSFSVLREEFAGCQAGRESNRVYNGYFADLRQKSNYVQEPARF